MSKRNFTPYPFYWDDVPVDLSYLFEDEKPAGKRGFLQVQKDKFVFEDGTEARFWGTNFNSGLNFPSFEFSEVIAKRLAKIGINLVRFHQLDAEWSTPNIFQFTKGKRKGHTLDFDPESMKRLDYLIYCLKQEGIYMYLDMQTYRKFKTGDGVENALLLDDSARPYSIYDSKLIQLQKKFNYDLWTHYNPYTELAYKDDPAIILTEVSNESDMFSRPVEVEPYKSDLVVRFKEWLQERDLDYGEKEIDFSDRNPTMLDFLCDIQENYYKEIISHLRSIGVKVPITGTNWAINAANVSTQLVTDFLDGHTYWYDWEWEEKRKKFKNAPMVLEEDSFIPKLSFNRVLDKPFFVSEWDQPWPSEWRAESPLYLAAVGGLQGWSGYAIHTYAYTSRTDGHVTGKEVTSNAIGNVPYREGVFNTWNDPAKFGLFYHAALMVRRGDVKEAGKSVAISMEDLSLTPEPESTPAISLISEKHKVGLEFANHESGADEKIAATESFVDKSEGQISSDTGELYRDWKTGYGWIDTDMTKAVYGFVGNTDTIALKDASFRAKTDFATIAISSISDEPINKADNMLLTAVGRSENTNIAFNEDHTVMTDVGEPPILIEVIEAEIKIKTDVPHLRVWAVNAEGFLAGVVPSEYRDGELTFTIGKQFPSMYYLIQSE